MQKKSPNLSMASLAIITFFNILNALRRRILGFVCIGSRLLRVRHRRTVLLVLLLLLPSFASHVLHSHCVVARIEPYSSRMTDMCSFVASIFSHIVLTLTDS